MIGESLSVCVIVGLTEHDVCVMLVKFVTSCVYLSVPDFYNYVCVCIQVSVCLKLSLTEDA